MAKIRALSTAVCINEAAAPAFLPSKPHGHTAKSHGESCAAYGCGGTTPKEARGRDSQCPAAQYARLVKLGQGDHVVPVGPRKRVLHSAHNCTPRIRLCARAGHRTYHSDTHVARRRCRPVECYWPSAALELLA